MRRDALSAVGWRRGQGRAAALRPAPACPLAVSRARGALMAGASSFVVLTLWCGAAHAQARSTPGPSGQGAAALGLEPTTVRELLVTGRTDAPPLLAGVGPDLEFGADELRAWGAGSLSELLQLLEPRISSAGARQRAPVFLIDGAPSADAAEVRDLPPEAILRMEVYPEPLAVRLGFGPDRRVINLVLRPQYRAQSAEVGGRVATEGGWASTAANLNALNIAGRARTQLDLKYGRASSLLESERGLPKPGETQLHALVPGSGAPQSSDPFADAARIESGRTLLPASEQLAASAVIGRPISAGASVAASAWADHSVSRSLLGRESSREEAALDRTTDLTTAHLNTVLNAARVGWLWSLQAKADHTAARTLTRASFSGAGGPATAAERLRSIGTSADAALLGSGRLLELPAGDLFAAFTLAAETQRFEGRRDRGVAISESADLDRQVGRLRASLEAPILDRPPGMPWLGALSASFAMSHEQLSDLGGLSARSFGLNWSPSAAIRFTVSQSRHEAAPSLVQLGAPEARTPGIRIFDATRGVAAVVDLVEGGNPALRPPRETAFNLAAVVKPTRQRNLILRVEYAALRTHDPIVVFASPTADLERSFPERFPRAADGRLVGIDSRPINLARHDRREVRWGISYSGQRRLGPLPSDTFVHFTIAHTLRLRERLRLNRSGPDLDVLAGFGGGAARARHGLEFGAGVSRAGGGARLAGTWRSEATLRGDIAGNDLDYEPFGTLDLHLFANLDSYRFFRLRPWARGSRLSLSVENLADARPRVRDAHGITPSSHEPERLEPLGRSIRLSLRKRL